MLPYGLIITAPAISEPVPLTELKAHLGIEQRMTDQDALLQLCITAAREEFEDRSGITLNPTTYKFTTDRFPGDKFFSLPRPPLISITSIQYYDSNDALQTWDSANYRVDVTRRPARVIALEDYPATSSKMLPAVEITFRAGAEVVPEKWKRAIRLRAAQDYEVRENVIVGTIVTPTPLGFDAAVSQARRFFSSEWNL